MHARCRYPSNDDYPRYGARGIKVCERWESFDNFLADMGQRPDGHTIERADVNGNYEAGNCSWATKAQQARNRTTNRVLELNGEAKSLAAWAEQLAMKPATLLNRLRDGWSVAAALNTPVKKSNAQSHALRVSASD